MKAFFIHGTHGGPRIWRIARQHAGGEQASSKLQKSSALHEVSPLD
jgi:hypothetical protein